MTKKILNLDNCFLDSGWIFGKKLDLVFFVGMLCILFIIQKYLSIENSGLYLGSSLAFTANFLYLSFLDVPHAVASFYQVYKPNNRKNFQMLQLLIPIIIVALIFPFVLLSKSLAYSIVTYFNIFHFIRQQYGWIRFSQNKSNLQLTAVQSFFDKLIIYVLTLVPVIMLHVGAQSQKQTTDWMFENDLFIISSQSTYIFLDIFFWFIVLSYTAFQIKLIYYGLRYPLGKLVILISTGLAWYGGLICLQNSEQTLMLDGLHVVPYIVLVYLFNRNKGKALYYIPLLSVGLAWALLFLHYDKSDSIGAAVVISVLISVAISHYVFDGFVWKTKSANADLNDFLSPDKSIAKQ